MPADGLMSYPGCLLGRGYSSGEMQSMYSTANSEVLTPDAV